MQHILFQCGRRPSRSPGTVVRLDNLRQALSEHPDSLTVPVADWADAEVVAAQVVP